MSEIIYRVQDHAGSGPFKPGFSHKWVIDREDLDNLHPWLTELGDVRKRGISGMWFGSGCRTIEQLRRWFTEPEYITLRGFGYIAVRMQVGSILGESATQLVFQRCQPLNEGIEPIVLYPKKIIFA